MIQSLVQYFKRPQSGGADGGTPSVELAEFPEKRTTAVIFALEPIYGITFAWLLFSEVPTLRMLAGGALIVCAIFISARSAR
jgi:threonine/homoserine efflux transporter RhtA